MSLQTMMPHCRSVVSSIIKMLKTQWQTYVRVGVAEDHRMEGMKRKCVASASAAVSQRKYQMGGV